MSEETSQAVQETPEIEQKAAAMGHMSKDEWVAKGRDPEKWRPASEFVERGENLMPILKERLEKQTREISEMRQTMQQLHQHFTQAEVVAEQRGWEKAINAITEKQRAAAEIADVDEFDRLEKEKFKLLSTPPQPPRVPKSPPPEFKEFQSRNEWYTQDEEMTIYADAIGFKMAEKNPNKTAGEIYAEIEKKVRTRFPEKFVNPRREEAAAVAGGTPAAKKGGKTFDDLPQSAKDAYHRFAKQIPNFKKEDYLRNYQW